MAQTTGRLYFDNAATSFPKPPEVYEALDAYARTVGGSAGRSAHAAAVAGNRTIFALRTELAEMMGGDGDLTILTKNATEAINLVLFSLLEKDMVVAHGALEHNAVMRPLHFLARMRHARLIEVPGDEHGRMTPAALAQVVAKHRPDLVVTLHASNVHGLAQDLAGLGEVCRQADIPLIVDAAQTGGCLPINMEEMGLAALCLTGHKSLLGPTGTGALLLSEEIADRMQPLLFGGTGSESEREEMPEFLPDRLEAGTANTIGAAGLLAGVRYLAQRTIEDVAEYEAMLRARMLERLREIPGLAIVGDAPGPATAVVSFCSPLTPSDLAFVLNEQYDIATRGGLHCAPRAHRALGTLPQGTLRLSPGPLTPPEAVDEVTDAIAEILENVS